MEIERKWLIKGLPENIDYYTKCYILQRYIMANKDGEARIRYCHTYSGEKVSPFKFTFKGPGTLSRIEVETELEEAQYNEIISQLPQEAKTNPIKKIFYKYSINEYKVEISEVDDSWWYAEVEFSSEEEAMSYEFPWPEIVIKEVTLDNDYKMKNYWIKTRGGQN